MHAGQPNRCHYGLGSYGSPTDQARCSKARNPKRQLCDSHEKLWKVEAKARRLARIAAELALANAATDVDTEAATEAALATGATAEGLGIAE